MRKIILGLLGLAVLAAAYCAYPFWVASALMDAVATRDRNALETYIDFPRVREGLKGDFNAQLLKGIAVPRGDPAAALGGAVATLVGPQVVETMVDALVTPAGLLQALAGHAALTGEDSRAIETRIRANVRSARFVAPDRFSIALGAADEPEENWVYVMMSLQGLTWRVTSLRLPEKAFPSLHG